MEWDQPEFETLLRKMGKERVDGARAVIVLDVWKVQTSCGYGVPKITLPLQLDGSSDPEDAFEDRKTLGHWASNKVEKNEMDEYRVKNNVKSLDGLPGLKSARRDAGERLWVADGKALVRRVKAQREAVGVGMLLGVFSVFLVGVLTRVLGL